MWPPGWSDTFTSRWHVITEHEKGRLVYDSSYLDLARTDALVVVQVFLSGGRTSEQKQAFYARTQARLTAEAGVGRGDVTITLVESSRTDWSFGDGIAQYVVLPPEQWK